MHAKLFYKTLFFPAAVMALSGCSMGYDNYDNGYYYNAGSTGSANFGNAYYGFGGAPATTHMGYDMYGTHNNAMGGCSPQMLNAYNMYGYNLRGMQMGGSYVQNKARYGYNNSHNCSPHMMPNYSMVSHYSQPQSYDYMNTYNDSSYTTTPYSMNTTTGNNILSSSITHNSACDEGLYRMPDGTCAIMITDESELGSQYSPPMTSGSYPEVSSITVDKYLSIRK